jgi:hypothetical protein
LYTIEKKDMAGRAWKLGKPIAEMLKHVADFKHRYDLKYKPGDWHPVTEEPGRD